MRRCAITAALLALVTVLTGFAVAASPQSSSSSATAPEFRALWVDAFHAGIRTPEEAEQLVDDAKRGHFNALMIQVRRRGDALYTQSLEPYVEDAPRDPNFDPLANIIELAHRNGIEVHAWINATPIWRDQPAPLDPKHAFNQHGLNSTGADRWLTQDREGEVKFPTGYSLDPGHPAVEDYLVNIYLNVVRHYAVDGIHFDYIRYPETAGKQLPRGADVGYNPVSIARFQRATGRADLPQPDDQQFIEWRRQQVTQLVRRVYIEAKAINPKLKITGAVIAWGRPPVSEQDFENVAPMQRIFQNWHGWLREGILDAALPMNYASESNPQVREWFTGWIDWEKQHQHGRRIGVGIGAYLNTPVQVLAQIERVRRPVKNNRAYGMCFFSYTTLSKAQPAPSGVTPAAMTSEQPAASPDRLAYLISGVGSSQAAFAGPASIPRLDWIDSPRTGYVAGFARAPDGAALDGGTVALRGTGWFSRTRHIAADGNGYFGFTNVKPGRYRVRVEQPGKKFKAATVEVSAGRVAHAEIQSQ